MNEVIVAGLIGIGVALLVIKVSALEGRLNRLSRLEAKVDALLKHAGVRFDEFQDVPADVRERSNAARRFSPSSAFGPRQEWA